MSSEGSALSALDETPLRFDVAHPNAPTKETTCSVCAQQVRLEYYEVEGRVVCASCRISVDDAVNGGSGGRRLARALGLGVLAAVGAAVGYAAFKTATGYDVGLVAILVGFIVGKAVHVGSGKRGGRRYQLLAATLTYFAISLSHLPGVLGGYRESHKAELDSISKLVRARGAARTGTATTSGDSAAIVTDAGKTAVADSAYTPVFGGGAMGTLVGLGGLVLLLVALPIMVGVSSIISVFLLIFALMQAWRMNRAVRLRITGPYRIAAGPAPELPAT